MPGSSDGQPEISDDLFYKPRGLLPTFIDERRIRFFAALENSLLSFTSGERLILYVFTVLLAGSTLFLVANVNNMVSVTVPSRGGELVEGAVGSPRFVNPLLAISQIDQDLTALVYSGLMRASQNRDLVPDIASAYEISEDGTQYTFHIREDARFHDGTPVTAGDVAFTVQLAQNADIKSPRRADWDSVTVTTPDERTVVFSLPHAYAPFLENTQLGILPKHLWEGVSTEEFQFHALNTHPIGSGPYKISDIQFEDTGTPKSYTLSSFGEFALGEPYLAAIIFRFYSNENALIEAFAQGAVDSFAGISPKSEIPEQRTDSRLVQIPSTRIFGIFFNQSHAEVLTDVSVRRALSLAVDKRDLIDSILQGFAEEANSPIPPGLFATHVGTTSPVERPEEEDRFAAAREALERGGWKFDEAEHAWTKDKQKLSISLSTADTAELAQTAERIAESWRTLGVEVNVQVYSLSEFNSTILRPRAYDAILFGEVVGRTLDLFAFWHSSQRNDPGLNLALYTNTRADKLLASAREETDRRKREELYRSFAEIVAEDVPAIFLYAPEFLYVVPERLQGVSVSALTTPSGRFLNAHEWYTDTERVWSVFTKQENDIISLF